MNKYERKNKVKEKTTFMPIFQLFGRPNYSFLIEDLLFRENRFICHLSNKKNGM